MSTSHNSPEKGSKFGQFVFIGFLLATAFIWVLWAQTKHNFEGRKIEKTSKVSQSSAMNSHSSTSFQIYKTS